MSAPTGDHGGLRGAVNVALSVWSNTCHAYCCEQDATHAPECRLAATLYDDLRAAAATSAIRAALVTPTPRGVTK